MVEPNIRSSDPFKSVNNANQPPAPGPVAPKQSPNIRIGNRAKAVNFGKDAIGIGGMMDKAANLLDKVNQQQPGATDQADKAIEKWNKKAQVAFDKGDVENGVAIQQIVDGFKQGLEEAKGPAQIVPPQPGGQGGPPSPPVRADKVRSRLTAIDQEAGECFKTISNPTADLADKKAALRQAQSLLNEVGAMSTGTHFDLKGEIAIFHKGFEELVGQAATLYRTDQNIQELKEGGGNKQAVLDLTINLVRNLPATHIEGRKEALSDVLKGNPDLFITNPDLSKRLLINDIIQPHEYVSMLSDKVSSMKKGSEKTQLQQELKNCYSALSDSDKKSSKVSHLGGYREMISMAMGRRKVEGMAEFMNPAAVIANRNQLIEKGAVNTKIAIDLRLAGRKQDEAEFRDYIDTLRAKPKLSVREEVHLTSADVDFQNAVQQWRTKVKKETMHEFDRILPNIILGTKGYRTLGTPPGVTNIFNFDDRAPHKPGAHNEDLSEEDREIELSEEIKYYASPITEHDPFEKSAGFNTIYSHTKNVLQDRKNMELGESQLQYFHCAAGANRSALVLIATLMEEHGLTAEEAEKVVYDGRPIAGLRPDNKATLNIVGKLGFNSDLTPGSKLEKAWLEEVPNFLYSQAAVGDFDYKEGLYKDMLLNTIQQNPAIAAGVITRFLGSIHETNFLKEIKYPGNPMTLIGELQSGQYSPKTQQWLASLSQPAA